MRELLKVSLVLGVGLAVAASASTASAAPGKEGTKNNVNRPQSDGAPSLGSDTGGQEETAGPNNAYGTRVLPRGANPDLFLNDRVEQKAWEIGGGFETHHLIRQDDGSGVSKQINLAGVYGQYDFSQYDRVRVRVYVNEYFIADQGESGFRLDDINVSYTRRIPLPHQFTLRASSGVLIPVSFDSERSSIVASPGVSLNLEKKVGRYLDLDANAGGRWFFNQYRSSEGGGDVNTKAVLSFGLTADLTMPFHEPLSLGVDVGTGYSWAYQPNTASDPNPVVQMYGAVADPQFSSQPVNQSYFGEIYLRYVMPTLFGVRSDILVAYADGDPVVGNVSVLHDGVGQFYGFFRNSSEVYAALSAAY